MDEKFSFALRKLALLGAIDDYVAISSRELGDALNMSQQSASKRILELLDEKLIVRDLGARRQRIRITPKGVDELKKEYNAVPPEFAGRKNAERNSNRRNEAIRLFSRKAADTATFIFPPRTALTATQSATPIL